MPPGSVRQVTSCINGTLYDEGTPNPTNACEVCTPATSTTAWARREAIPLLVGGTDITTQGWTAYTQAPDSLTYGSDSVRLETSTPTNARTSGQLLVARANTVDPSQPFKLRVTMLPQAGAEPGLEEESPGFAATVEEPRKERTPRLDWAGLLKQEVRPGCVGVHEVWRQT